MQDRPAKLQEYQTYIGGKWCGAASGKSFETLRPLHRRAVGAVPRAMPADVDRAVEAAYTAFTTGPGPR